jgi:hypothetical protein
LPGDIKAAVLEKIYKHWWPWRYTTITTNETDRAKTDPHGKA